MKIMMSLLVVMALLAVSCVPKKPEPKQMAGKDPHAGMDMQKMREMMQQQQQQDPHAGMDMNSGGGLDLDGMMSTLPDGWTKTQPTSSMRVAQIALAPTKGDKNPAEIAIFHFPGSGGSSGSNIVRWQNQFKGPKGEPGPQVAKTDTMMVGLFTVITTDVIGTQLGGGAAMGTGPAEDVPGSRMIASVIETPSGNWFVKMVGPEKTVAANAQKFRDFVKKAKLKDPAESAKG